MAELTGGDAVVEALLALDVGHVFGIASVHNLPICDAIHRRDGIRLVPVRHEQAAVHAADGYARASGRLGVALTSTGPGTANAMGGLFEAATASSRVLLITGQVERTSYGQGRGVLHEAEHQVPMLRSLCRRIETVRHGEDVGPAVVRTAVDVLSGRGQPGAVEIPIDLQRARTNRSPLPVPRPFFELPSSRLVDEAARRLTAARRPLLWAGGGVIASDAAAAFRSLAEQIGAPVVTSIEGRGAIPEGHPLCLGPIADYAALRPVIEEADLVLAVGTRFQLSTAGQQALSLKGVLVHADADASVIGRVHRAEVALVGDARATLERLVGLLDGHVGKLDAEYLARAASARAQARADSLAAIGHDHAQIMDAIRSRTPQDAVIVKDVTVAALVWANRWLEVHQPRTSIRPVSVGIGPGLPLAVGAAIATGRRTVLIQGDGGLMASLGELATAAQEEAPVVICVFNDRGYGVLRWAQDTFFGGRRTGVDLATPDFVTLAAAVGVPGEAVASSAEFPSAFTRGLEADGPYLLDIDLSNLAPMEVREQP